MVGAKEETTHQNTLKEAESYLKNWRRKHVDYERLELEPYQLT